VCVCVCVRVCVCVCVCVIVFANVIAVGLELRQLQNSQGGATEVRAVSAAKT
jgi:hypothetical protein